MQLLKKVISLLLVVAMLSSFALVASAEDAASKVGVFLDVCDANGNLLTGESKIQQGDTIKVKLRTDTEWSISLLQFYIAYDSTVLEYDEEGSSLPDDVKKEFDNKDLHGFVQNVDEPGLPKGETAVTAVYGAPLENHSFAADTVWAEMLFTALAPADASELRLIVFKAFRLDDNDVDFVNVSSELEPHNASVAIAAAPATVKSIAVTPDSVTLNPDKTQQLTAAITPSEAEATITWESNNTDVATVSNTGLVTAVGAGDAVITATAGEKTAICTVKVEASDPITEFECYGVTERSIVTNGTVDLSISWATSDGSEPVVTWTATGDDCVTISNERKTATLASCTVTGTKIGTAHVTATSGTHSATFTVEVLTALASRVVIDDLDTSLKYAIGMTLPLKATVTPTGEWDVKWTSSDPTIAQVEGDKLVTVGAGTVTVTAKAGGQTASKTITVVDNSQSAKGDYTVDMSGDATQRVITNQKVSIPITIAANNSEAFNAVDLTVTFDPTKLEAVNQVEGLDGCNVDISNGKIHVTRYGVNQATPTIMKVSFNVKMTEGTTEVVLAGAYVDLSANALAKDAPPAAISCGTTTLEIVSVHTVTLPDTMESTQGNTVADGGDYTFSVKDKDAYHDYDVKATMGGADVTVIENTDGTYTIKNVTGDVTIQMTATAKTYHVDFIGPDVTGEDSATYGQEYTFTIAEQEGFTYGVSVTIGGKAYTVGGVSGKYTIPGSEVKGDINVVVTKKNAAGKNIYTVKVEGEGASAVEADATATDGTAFAFKLTPEPGYYYTVTVAVNGTPRTPTVTENSDGTKTYTVAARHVKGNILIEVAKDEAYTVTFEYPTEIIDSDGISVTGPSTAAQALCITLKNAESLVKKGGTYTFTVETFAVYDLKCEVTENGAAKVAQETLGKLSGTRQPHTFTIENVQGDLHIKLSRVANTKYVEVQVKPFVELDDKTVFLVATCTKDGGPTGTIQLDTYDGHPMYRTKTYMSTFENPSSRQSVYLWLTIVPKGESYGVEQALEHLYYTNNSGDRPGASQSEGIRNNADVNLSGMVDINDAQLIFDIYNGEYQSFYRTNAQETDTIPNFGIGASMDKFLEADVNRDMKVDVNDAAAIVAKIK